MAQPPQGFNGKNFNLNSMKNRLNEINNWSLKWAMRILRLDEVNRMLYWTDMTSGKAWSIRRLNGDACSPKATRLGTFPSDLFF